MKVAIISYSFSGNTKRACFLTYGSGLGKKKAIEELEGILKAKGGRILFSKNIPGVKTSDKEYLDEQFKSLIDIVCI